MAKIAKKLTELIGHTPLMELSGYSRKYGLQENIVAKLESFNPAGSVKDRVALSMIEDAEERGVLQPGATIIEPTSGNTGVGLAMVATIKGYRLILTMPETMSLERRNLLKALGAQIVLTNGQKGMAGSIAKAEELKKSIPGCIYSSCRARILSGTRRRESSFTPYTGDRSEFRARHLRCFGCGRSHACAR